MSYWLDVTPLIVKDVEVRGKIIDYRKYEIQQKQDPEGGYIWRYRYTKLHATGYHFEDWKTGKPCPIRDEQDDFLSTFDNESDALRRLAERVIENERLAQKVDEADLL